MYVYVYACMSVCAGGRTVASPVDIERNPANHMEDYVVHIAFEIECYSLLPSGIAFLLILKDIAGTMTYCSTNACRCIPIV